jgi:Protein of unknown function (DUF4242)
MDIYMVERELPGINPEQLAGAQRAAIATSQQFTAQGTPVRYIRSTFVPDESKCFCLFEAASRQAVRDVNTAAKLPFTRIVQALDLTPAAMMPLVAAMVLATACGANPVAPSQRADIAISPPAQLAPAATFSSRPAASCANIDANVTAALQADGTATGVISGDITGAVTAAISQITPPGDPNGALHVLMEHHYTNASPYGRVDTSDHAVLAPSVKSDGVYRMNNRLTIVGGDGIYSGATGELRTHGTVDFGTGEIDLTLHGRLCR